MINKYRKGKRIELLAKKELIKEGWFVEQKNHSKWQGKDFFGLFDIVAIHPVYYMKWIQIKSNRNDFYTARKKIKAWLTKHNLNICAEVWLKESHKKWRKEHCSTLNKKWYKYI